MDKGMINYVLTAPLNCTNNNFINALVELHWTDPNCTAEKMYMSAAKVKLILNLRGVIVSDCADKAWAIITKNRERLSNA